MLTLPARTFLGVYEVVALVEDPEVIDPER